MNARDIEEIHKQLDNGASIFIDSIAEEVNIYVGFECPKDYRLVTKEDMKALKNTALACILPCNDTLN